jgi:hypothetical protein
VLRAFQRKIKSKMPWRDLIFTEHGIVFPAPPTQQTTAKKQQDMVLSESMERLGMSDTACASSATTPSLSRSGSAALATPFRHDAVPPASLPQSDEPEELPAAVLLRTPRLRRTSSCSALHASKRRGTREYGSRSPISVAKRATNPVPASRPPAALPELAAEE